MIKRLNIASPLLRSVLAIASLSLFGTTSSASVIYEYRELGSTGVIGTLEIMSPPANTGSGWSTGDLSDLVALFLDDLVFGLGTGDLFSAGSTSSAPISSLHGMKLDSGGIGITFPTIIPSDPNDPTINQSLTFTFDVPAGADFIGLSTVHTFPDGNVIIGDLFLDGDWTASERAVPEPSTFALLAFVVLAARRSVRRS